MPVIPDAEIVLISGNIIFYLNAKDDGTSGAADLISDTGNKNTKTRKIRMLHIQK